MVQFKRIELAQLDGEMGCTVNNFTVGNVKRQLASLINKGLVIIQTLENNSHLIIARMNHMTMIDRQQVLNSRLFSCYTWHKVG